MAKGIGMRKHRKSGRAGKSPRLRLLEKMRAEADEIKVPKSKMFGSIEELKEYEKSTRYKR